MNKELLETINKMRVADDIFYLEGEYPFVGNSNALFEEYGIYPDEIFELFYTEGLAFTGLHIFKKL